MQRQLDADKLEIVEALAFEFVEKLMCKSLLIINTSWYSIFPEFPEEITTIVNRSDEITQSEDYSLIFGNFGLSQKYDEIEVDGEKYKYPENWNGMLGALRHLEDAGYGFFIMEPLGFSSSKGQRFEELLNEIGYYVCAYFNAPDEIFAPETTITPIIVSFTRQKTDKVFVAELVDENQAPRIVDSFINNDQGNNLLEGYFIQPHSFSGFKNLKIEEQFNRLKKQYESYSKEKLGEISESIIQGQRSDSFEDLENCIYIPKVGSSPVISLISELQIKQQNYFQVKLKDSIKNDYLVAFFKTKIGQLALESVTTFGVVPHKNKARLDDLIVFFPKTQEQQAIIYTNKMLKRLRNAIREFEEEISFNPISAVSIQEQLNPMMDAIGQLTEIDKVSAMIRQGETKQIEFKQTLSYDIRKKTKAKYIETEVLKNIVAFLNTEGGDLLVGVDDHGEVIGVDYEIEKFYHSDDGFKLKLKNLIKARIGEQYYPYIDYKFLVMSGKKVCRITCRTSPQPCWLDNNEFYVRTNPATDKLVGPVLHDYLKNHFN